MTQNSHVCAICCRPEGDCDVISGGDVKTIVRYVVVNFVVASSNSFRENREKIFPGAEVDGGTGGINAICNRPGVADDVISGYNVETFSGLPCCECMSC